VRSSPWSSKRGRDRREEEEGKQRRKLILIVASSSVLQLNFLKVLEARMKGLVAAGRDVMIVGDMNVVHQPMDHGEGSLASKQEGFWNHP